MACPIGPAELKQLKLFIDLCSLQPQILNLPQLEFFKAFIEKLGGKVPEGTPTFGTPPPKTETPKPETKEDNAEKSESEPESDLEFDDAGCVPPDTDQPQSMGDPTKEPSEEDLEIASTKRSLAAAAYSEQNYEEAVKLYSEAIELNPTSAAYHAKRGQVFLKLVKPNACIRDCNRALEINPDSAIAYKFRGRANRLLGKWEEAAKDLRQACKLDFDEEADEWLKEVTPKASLIEQHKRKQDRKREEKELRKRQEASRRAQEARRKAAEQNPRSESTPDLGEDAAGAEDILNAFKDPEVAAALQDIMSNPANISKYQNNPKIMNLIMKVAKDFPMAGGFPGFPGAGAFPGGAGGFPDFGEAQTDSSAPSGGGSKCTDDLD